MFYHARTSVERINWISGEGMLFSFPILTPMWYLRDLMVLCILSPVVYWLLCPMRRFGRYVSLALIALIYITAFSPFIPGLSPEPVLFFSMGAFFSLSNMNLTTTFKKAGRTIAVLFVILWLLIIPFAGAASKIGNYLFPFFIITGVVSIINLFSSFNEERLRYKNRLVNKVSDFCLRHEADVFFIFAAHSLLIPYIAKMLNYCCSIITGTSFEITISTANKYCFLLIVCYLLRIVLVITICTLISSFINGHMPKIRKLLSGR